MVHTIQDNLQLLQESLLIHDGKVDIVSQNLSLRNFLLSFTDESKVPSCLFSDGKQQDRR